MDRRPDPASEAFVRLMTEHQGRLFGYVLSLVGDPDRANEVLQETNVVLWRDHAEFRPGSNFSAWAFRVAHFQVMAYRQRRIRDRLVFDDGMVELLAPEAKELDDAFDARQQKLTDCLGKLSPAHRELLRRRYAEGEAVETLARERGMTANAAAQALFRIRRILIQCVGGSPA
jgi:RNA polymerase sigma-70 factor (ECF subfamily)